MEKENKHPKTIKTHPYKDLRCSRGCVHNYYKFNLKPPPYVFCICSLPKL